jgi:Ca2+-binding RTX toxin-like protein
MRERRRGHEASCLAASTLVLAVSAGSGLQPRAEASHITKCFGQSPDQNRSHDPSGSSLVLTSGHDVVIGSPFTDHIEGRGGRDFICAIGGGDEVSGGRRADKLSGGRGADEIFAGRGDDLLKGGAGQDHGNGRPGRDICVDIEIRTSCEVVR